MHKHFRTRTLYNKHFLHKDAFAHRHFYPQTLLHTDTFTHRRFYTQTLYTKIFYTEAFTHKPFYSQMLLQTNIFTLKHVYTQRLFYTQRLSLTEPFGDNSFSYFAGKFGNHNFTSGFGDRTSFHTKGSRLDKRNCNFTSVFGDWTSFRLQGCIKPLWS